MAGVVSERAKRLGSAGCKVRKRVVRRRATEGWICLVGGGDGGSVRWCV